MPESRTPLPASGSSVLIKQVPSSNQAQTTSPVSAIHKVLQPFCCTHPSLSFCKVQGAGDCMVAGMGHIQASFLAQELIFAPISHPQAPRPVLQSSQDPRCLEGLLLCVCNIYYISCNAYDTAPSNVRSSFSEVKFFWNSTHHVLMEHQLTLP